MSMEELGRESPCKFTVGPTFFKPPSGQDSPASRLQAAHLLVRSVISSHCSNLSMMDALATEGFLCGFLFHRAHVQSHSVHLVLL